MDVVVGIVATIAEYTVAPIGNQLGYLIQYTSNTESLRVQVESLKSVQHGNQGEVDAAERNGQVIREDVLKWLTSVNKITRDSDSFFRDEVNPNLRCSAFSSCPNLVLRYKVSRKAKKMKLVVDELLLKGKFNNVSFLPAPPPIPESLNVYDAEVFKLRDSTFNGIIEALKDDKTNIIGVYGMGGTGKTTLVKHVANQVFNEYKLFDQIVMAVVSQTPSITKIQDDIALMLGLTLHERESVLKRADQLCERIKMSKRILVILDDLWTKLNLKEIGLPQVDVHNGCKILLTTRDLQVCVQMQSQIDFMIGILDESEAWDLFRKTVGDVVDSSNLKPIAIDVAKECAGLPLCIVTVARALMKKKDLGVWRDALRRLQNPSTTSISGMDAKVYSSLQLSYDFLDDAKAKDCFLLCCLAEEDSDIRINNLVGFGIGLGMFDNECRLPQIKDTVRTSVTKLKDRCLLLEGKYVECVRMNGIVRDFAISVVSKHGSWARKDIGRTKGSQKILSALNNDQFDCSTLEMLFLKSYDYSLVPNNFFERGKDIRVLSMQIPKLPLSVLCLVNLQTLYLEDCSVKDITFIGKLKCLEALSFVHCQIQELPREIKELERLRVLELSNCVGLKVIPTGVISSLSRLEGLHMYKSLVEWENDGNACLIELNSLPYLNTIEMHLPDVKLFPKDLHLVTLSEFKISLGTEFSGVEWNDSFFPGFDADDTFKCFKPRMLKIGNIDQSIASHVIKRLVNKAESLIIEHFEVDLENILSELKRERFSRLKCLKVVGNQKIEYLVDETKEEMLQKIFPALEGLKLENMQNLREICRGRLPSESFCELCELELNNLPNLENLWVGNASLMNLRVVKISDCGSMKNLFSQNVLSGFGQLSSLQIKNCQNIEVILAYDGAEAIEEDEIEFSNFTILRLSCLPNLTTFYNNRRNHISDRRDDALPPIQKAFFSEKIVFSNLNELVVSGSFQEIWPPQVPGNSFCRLTDLEIYDCDKLTIAIPSNMVKRLQNLKRLVVRACEMMKEIVANTELVGAYQEEAATQKEEEIKLFPQLRTLQLMDMQKLTYFYRRSSVLNFPSLEEISIENCPKIETIVAKIAKCNVTVLHKCFSMKRLDIPR